MPGLSHSAAGVSSSRAIASAASLLSCSSCMRMITAAVISFFCSSVRYIPSAPNAIPGLILLKRFAFGGSMAAAPLVSLCVCVASACATRERDRLRVFGSLARRRSPHLANENDGRPDRRCLTSCGTFCAGQLRSSGTENQARSDLPWHRGNSVHL